MNPAERRPNPKQFLPEVPIEGSVTLRALLRELKKWMEALLIDPDPPARPTAFTAADYRSGAALLKWPPTPKATGYRLWRNTSNAFDTATLVIELTGFGNIQFVDIVPSATSYWYWLQGVNAAHVSGPLTDAVKVTVTT